ncbi:MULTISPECIES: HpcH/HpaI aldolase family protein [Rhodobacterales]|uniref:HpcH/HpaI aldolase family protein n=1 Tax=Rhodobacterales TaxID=204455 RepID=UPI0011200491|nr:MULTISPECIES: aldolase/citrate lyase family protein [Rhodobacterales]MBS8226176.1 4-hydroxy-2-oxo-heptane-1,7-dioate aldolase [Vannielia litorea]QDC11127.1 4-hydroxy-2-oxo-heptane-1,7-dioate aldolase [Oceanicola sp. D3]
MDMPKNAFKAAIAEGRLQVGIWNTIPDPGVVELLAGTGYDWILLDSEHTPVTIPGLMPLMQAAGGYPVTTIARPGWNDMIEIKRLLDQGAQTLLIPYVQSVEEAELAVRHVRYPPRGVRGVGGTTRASRYGAVKDYIQTAEQEICLLVQIETVEAMAQAEEIAAVDGVDGIFIGPADFAASMGYPGQPTHPEVKAAILDGIRRIKAAGKAPGILTLDPTFQKEAEEAGAVFVAVTLDASILRAGAIAARERFAG